MELKKYVRSLNPKLFGAEEIENIEIRDLPKGIWNYNNLVEINGKKFVFKAYSEGVPGLLFGNNSEDEIKALKALEGEGIAPKPVLFEKSEILDMPVLMYEYVEGSVLKKYTKELLTKLARKTAVFHSKKPDNIPKEKETTSYLKENCRETIEKCSGLDLSETFEKHLDRVEVKEMDYESGLVHGDITPCNVIVNDEEIRIIDWQRPSVSDPAFDVWAFMEDAFPMWDLDEPISPGLKEHFKKEYLKHSEDETIMERMREKSDLYYINVGVYCLLRYNDFKTGKIPKERTKGREHLWEKYKVVRDVCLERLEES